MRLRIDKQGVLLTGGILGVAVAFWVLLCGPQFKRIDALNASVRVAQQDVAEGPSAVDIIASFERDVAELADRAADMDEQVPNQERIGSFLEELARLIGVRGLVVRDIEPGDVVRSTEVMALPITIRVRGAFPSVHALMRDLERMTRVTRIERFRTEIDDVYSGTVTAEVSMRVYCRAS